MVGSKQSKQGVSGGKETSLQPEKVMKSREPPQARESATPPPPSTQPAEQHEQLPPLPPLHTSRLCVKNVPKDITLPKLKEHFAAKGEVTDVKILKTRSVFNC